MAIPKCSVVVTCYNYARYIPPCLESVLGQTYQDFEIVIINDGSTDNTDEVIVPFLTDERIRYIKQANAGQAKAKNVGIEHARGELIAFLDADDLWEATKLEKQLPRFDDVQVGVVYSGARYVDDQGQDVPFAHHSTYLQPRSGIVTQNLFFDNFIAFSSSIVRKMCFDDVGLFDESIRMGIDWDLWLRISVRYRFAYVDEPLLYYRIGHPGQMSKNLDVRQECSDRIMARFLDLNPGIIPKNVIRKAYAYTYCNRGYYFRGNEPNKALRFYGRALKSAPGNIHAIKGIIITVFIMIKNILKRLKPCATRT